MRESKAKNKIPYTVQKKIEPQENKHTATNNFLIILSPYFDKIILS